jgi:hypothetical protein
MTSQPPWGCTVSDAHNPNELGYGRPPQRTQFVKGQSGNPNGRPKGSQNFATILAKAGRQRIKVTENGRVTYKTKFQAVMLQLVNKAVTGDLKAIAELQDWIKFLADREQAALETFIPHERDKAVMANILKRIRQSEEPPEETKTDSTTTYPSKMEK